MGSLPGEENWKAPTSTAGKPIVCKAAVMWKAEEDYKFENIVVAPPRTKQVRIKILYTAICHTDITTSKLKALPHIFPVVLGHEASGIVESVGEGVAKVKAGDHVLPYCLGQCDHCYNCINDLTNMCKSRPLGWGVSTTLVGDPEPHFTTVDGTALNRLMAVSTFSEYTVVHEEHVVKLNPELDLEKSCLLSCGVSTGIGAVWNVAKVTPGATVAIVGLGTIGLAVVKACQVAGASRIIGVDTNPLKFEKAKKFGLTDFINPKEITKPLPQVIQEMTDGGVHYSFECVGVPKLMEDTVDSTVPQYGVTVIVGSPAGPQKMEVDVFSLLQGRKITGTSMGGWRVRQIPELAEKCLGKNPEFPVDQFATHRLPFSKLNEGIELFHSGDCLRCILYLEE